MSPALPRRVAPVRPPLRAFVTAALSRQGGVAFARHAYRAPWRGFVHGTSCRSRPFACRSRQLLRATHSYSGSRTGCLALSWPSVRVRFLILGDVLSHLHTALSFPKFSPKSWPRRSAPDLVYSTTTIRAQGVSAQRRWLTRNDAAGGLGFSNKIYPVEAARRGHLHCLSLMS